VCVIGGGPAGAAAAITLCRCGHDVVLLAPATPGSAPLGESLPPGGGRLLAELDVLTEFADCGHLESMGSAAAWGTHDLAYRDYLFDGQGPGWHLDRARFDRTLADGAVRAGARLVNDRDRSARRDAAGRWIICAGADSVHADVVVDATGRGARFASSRGAAPQRVDRLVGVAAVLPAGADAIGHTLIEAAPDGWWYAAPQTGGQVLVAWLSDSDLVREHGFTSQETWAGQLARTTHIAALVRPTTAPRLTVRSAASQLLRPCAGPDWIAVGDAAMATDPLASAGILSALASGTTAAGLIASGGLRHEDVREAHDARLARRFADFLCQRGQYYQLEKRWNTAFWRRRGE
jgi:flavin-dependent dehydrogenase